jgi:hypothetical protein
MTIGAHPDPPHPATVRIPLHLTLYSVFLYFTSIWSTNVSMAGDSQAETSLDILSTARRVAAGYRPWERCEAESAAVLALWQATCERGPLEPGLAWRVAVRAASRAVQRDAAHGLTGLRDPAGHRPSWSVLPAFVPPTALDGLSA